MRPRIVVILGIIAVMSGLVGLVVKADTGRLPLARVDLDRPRHYLELRVGNNVTLMGRQGSAIDAANEARAAGSSDTVETGLPLDLFRRNWRTQITVVHENANTDGLITVDPGDEYAWDMILNSDSAAVSTNIAFYDSQRRLIEAYQLMSFQVTLTNKPFSYGQRFLVPHNAHYLAPLIGVQGKSTLQVVDSQISKLQ